MRCKLSTRLASLACLATLAGGCWNNIQEHCRRCVIVDEHVPRLPAMAPDTRAVVILVHGAFGFGDEWQPLVTAVRARPHAALVAFGWSGPFARNPSRAAEALLQLVQVAVDEAPPAADILVIAHSAGGALAEFAAERLRVPQGRHVRIASIAAPAGMNLAPFHPATKVNTPLGIAVGGEQAPKGPIAANVDFTAYATADPPTSSADAAQPGVHRVWLGASVSHNGSVALAGLPLIDALPQ